MPAGIRVHKTPKGFHLLFQYNPDLSQTQSALKGVDIRNDGGYIIAPPSSNNGVAYSVERDRPPVALPSIPPGLSKNGRTPSGGIAAPVVAARDKWVTEALQGVNEKQRNQTAARLIGYFHHKGIPSDIIEAQMMEFAKRCTPPMDTWELQRTIESVTRYQQHVQAEQITSAPEFQQDGDDFVFTWAQQQIQVKLSEMYHTRDGLKVCLQIDTSQPGRPKTVYAPANWNLRSSSGRSTLVNYLKKRMESVDWASIMETTVTLAYDMWEEGEPVVFLNQVTPTQSQYALTPFLQNQETTVIFGDGGTGKSYLAIGIAMNLHSGEQFIPFEPLSQHRGLILDWETNKETNAFRVQQLAYGIGLVDGLPDLAYQACRMPLHDMVRQIKGIITKHSISHLVIDNAAAACGGDPEKAEVAMQFFNALRMFKTTNTVIAHQTKAAQDEAKRGNRKPFGSAFWHNVPRATFEVVREEEPQDGVMEIGIFNHKANNDARAKPIGLRLNFGAEWVMFERTKLDAPDLTERLSVKDRLVEAYRQGALTNLEVVAELALPLDTVQKTQKRWKDKLFTPVLGTTPVKWGNIQV
jgi:hypothetical protein